MSSTGKKSPTYSSVPRARTHMEVIHSKNAIIVRKEVSIPIGEDVYEAIGRIYGELEGELFQGRYLSPNSTEKGLSEAEGMKATSTVEVSTPIKIRY